MIKVSRSLKELSYKAYQTQERLGKELMKLDSQIDKKVNEIQEIEELLFKIEKYKIENNIR